MKIRVRKKYLPHLIIIFFGLLLLFMGIANHYYFRTVTFDYGNYNFAFRDYSHFRISMMPTYSGNFLQDHFSFTLMYFIPVYWLFNWITGTYTLIIIQYSLVLVAAWYTYRLVMLKANNMWLGAGVLVYYFVLLGRFTTFSSDVNLAVIASCFIPIFLYLFEKKKYIGALIIFILALLSRENIPLWFMFIFIVLIILHWKDKKAVLFSVAGIILSLIYFILIFKVFIPLIETEEKQFTLFNYSALGADPGEAFLFALQNPVQTLKLFFVNHHSDPALDWVKAEFYIVYMVSGGIILFYRPQYLIWFIPIVAQKMLNDSFIRWGISTYYSIEVVTLLPLSVFLTISSFKRKTIQNKLIVIVLTFTISMTLYKLEPNNVEIPWTMNPKKEKFYAKEFYQPAFSVQKTNTLLKRIPPHASVSASDNLFPHLAYRDSIYLFPEVKEAEYIVFSVFDNNFNFSRKANEQYRNKYLFSSDWEIIEKDFPVFLLKKRGMEASLNQYNVEFEYHPDTILCNFESVDSVNNLVYFSDGTEAIQARRIVSGIAKSGNASLLLDPQNNYGTFVELNDAENIEYIYATVWYNSSANNANIVASCGNQFYVISWRQEDVEINGWKKLELGFWVPRHLDLSNLKLYLWNSEKEPAYFDDFQIVKRYKKESSQVVRRSNYE